MGKKFNLLITVIFTIASVGGFLYVADILFVQIPSNNFSSSNDFELMYGIVALGVFTGVGIWASINQIRLWKIT